MGSDRRRTRARRALLRAAIGVVVGLALLAEPAAAVAKQEYLPHNVFTGKNVGGCTFVIAHGNLWGVAYTEIASLGQFCMEIRFRTVAMLNGRLVATKHNVAFQRNPPVRTIVNNGQIIASELNVCAGGDVGQCYDVVFTGVR
jgi:hypothetical protein